MRWVFIVLVVIAIAILVVMVGWKATPHPSLVTREPQDNPVPLPGLMVKVLDVGQGDSIFIKEGTTEILIDGGVAQEGNTVVNDIKPLVEGSLDVVVLTHPDADHVGGLTAVLENFKVDQLWWNGQFTTSQAFQNFNDQRYQEEESGMRSRIVKRGDEFEMEDLVFTVLNTTGAAMSTNDAGVVLNLTYGITDFLFNADVSQVTEREMLDAGVLPANVDVLKVGHHCSKMSSCAEFLAQVHPKYAIYSCGVGNTYGFPTSEAIDRLKAVHAVIYGTDINGTVTVISDGSTIAVTGEDGK